VVAGVELDQVVAPDGADPARQEVALVASTVGRLLGLARNLPETALSATSRRPTTQPSAASQTWTVVWSGAVVHGVVNHPRIDGKDGVAGWRVLAFHSSTDVNDSGSEHLVGDLLRVEVGAPGWYSDHRPTELH
jgi:hypothetical protein